MSIVAYQKTECNLGLPPLLWGKSWIIDDVLQLFLSTFTFSNLLTFESVGRSYCHYTEKRWKQLRLEERFNFEWTDSKTEKTHYIQSKVLFSYRAQPQSCFSSAEAIQALYNRFEGVMLAYPHGLGAYIWEDLESKGAVTPFHASTFQFQCFPPNTAGDVLLVGLRLLKKGENVYVDETIREAIYRGATCASLLALEYPITAIFRKRWVLLSALYKDYRALEKLLFQISPLRAKKYYKEGLKFPPVFAGYARQLTLKGKHVKADKFWDRAIEAYEGQVPLEISLDAAHTKFHLQKYQEAESLFEAYIDDQQEKNGSIESQVWEDMGTTKYFLGKYGEAQILFKKSIHACEVSALPVPPNMWKKLAYTESWLGKFEDADTFFEKCMTAHKELGLPISPNLWANRASMNQKLKHYEQAELFFDQALIDFTAQNLPVPPELLLDAAQIKYSLNKREEADALVFKVTGIKRISPVVSEK